ncbi:MAG: hypothetical protein E3J37_05225 [Anaerolineales bacterium]|nr:MAG: hypothetical protein E3J37_05225 [Anaerolineales bacterium]
MTRIRIKGLVSLMNHAREQLANGIPASEVHAFKQMVLDATAFVEESCRQRRASLGDLPAPSRRAYEYLKSIELDQLPVLEGREAKAVSSIRISNIVASCRLIQREFAELARADAAVTGDDEDLEMGLVALHQRVGGLASLVDDICEDVGANPNSLPDPTRRAYQWLKFLSEQGNFQQHFRTLTRAYHGLGDGRIELYNIAGLYRSRIRKGIRRLVISEGFVGAPLPVIEALMYAAVAKQGGAHKVRIRQYTETEEFRETLLAIEMIGVQLQEKTRGAYYDLEDVFLRVNNRYFKGRMKKPILTWNKTITHGKFGHYVPATGTLMISIALDSRDVPSYVIDHVMHHELLHRKMGVKIVNSRRIAHTSEFRAEERSFEHYHEAQAFLTKMSRELQ